MFEAMEIETKLVADAAANVPPATGQDQLAGASASGGPSNAGQDPQAQFRECLKAITDKKWSTLFQVRQDLQRM